MREREGEEMRGRQARKRKEECPAAEKLKLGLGSETTTKSPSNNQQRAGSSLAFLELLHQRRWGQERQKEEIDGLKGMREGRKEATMDDFFLSAESNNAKQGGRQAQAVVVRAVA